MINVCESLVTEYVQCTTECGLEAGDQSAARLAQLIIGYVGGYVHAEGSARELILYTLQILIGRLTLLRWRLAEFLGGGERRRV